MTAATPTGRGAGGGVARRTGCVGGGTTDDTMVGRARVDATGSACAGVPATAVGALSDDVEPAGLLAIAITPVSPITADAARPVAAMRVPAAACLRRGIDRRARS